MRSFYRLTGLISTLSLVATFLVTSGFVCAGPDATSRMADMGMGSMPVDQRGSDTRSSPDAPDAPPSSCDFPATPSACQSMAPCAPAATVAQRISLSDISSEVFHVASASLIQPPSETIAPEPPPPRA
jgi:hypothetical protein